MRVAIIYSPQHHKLENVAKELGKTIESSGHRVEYIPIGQTSRPPNIRIFDFIYLGSITEGFWGGKIPSTVSDYIKQCRGFENSKSAAFILKRILGNNKSLKRLMALLESMGSQVMDFQVIAGKSDIEALGTRLRK